MWNRVRTEGRTRGSPLYKGVCNRLAVSGCSMGSGSALIMAGTYTKPEDGIVALGYIHGTLVDPSFIESVEVPTLIGGGTADTLNSGDTYFLSFNTTVNRNPIMTVMLEGTPHVSGTRSVGTIVQRPMSVLFPSAACTFSHVVGADICSALAIHSISPLRACVCKCPRFLHSQVHVGICALL